jgi:ribosomal protein S18 acetylase RimI-like enzyme
MTPVRLLDRDTVEAFYRPDRAAHLYELGDLDDAFWPDAAYYGLTDETGGGVWQVALLYRASDALSILLATTEPERRGAMCELLAALAPSLPDVVYTHVDADTAGVLLEAGGFEAESHGTHLKMVLEDAGRVAGAGTAGATVRLSPEDCEAVNDLYAAAYPDGWFDERLLGTGLYFGVWDGARLLSVAGVHVASARYGVAALGNVATHPDARGRGLARAACAALCRDLLARGMRDIGLNVRADNAAAVACYRGLGFVPVAEYEEMMLTRRRP